MTIYKGKHARWHIKEGKEGEDMEIREFDMTELRKAVIKIIVNDIKQDGVLRCLIRNLK